MKWTQVQPMRAWEPQEVVPGPGAPRGSPLFLSLLPRLTHCQAALSALSLLPENSYSFTETPSRVDCSLVLGQEGCGPWGQLTAIFNILESPPHPDEMRRELGNMCTTISMHQALHVSRLARQHPSEADFSTCFPGEGTLAKSPVGGLPAIRKRESKI